LHPPGSINRVPPLIGWVRGGNVTSVGWQLTLCDPVTVRLCCNCYTRLRLPNSVKVNDRAREQCRFSDKNVNSWNSTHRTAIIGVNSAPTSVLKFWALQRQTVISVTDRGGRVQLRRELVCLIQCVFGLSSYSQTDDGQRQRRRRRKCVCTRRHGGGGGGAVFRPRANTIERQTDRQTHRPPSRPSSYTQHRRREMRRRCGRPCRVTRATLCYSAGIA